ncbi:MAG: hypothetical protein CFH41_01250 [Alphaproteobacteria bacterium MarineAlpha11_Bin1]|nr:MAG: hypothetical protein CFH41_01250 [Alphaproteobacteria bacterium MarineAlpha11_Bin1]|tara:strand:+ start:239 stop:1168 length:930 start_codon:yes stop_codon:yes gene_type:complete
MALKLMFTGGGGAGNEAIYRQWRDRYDMTFADADSSAIDPLIPEDRRCEIPLANAPGYSEALGVLCCEHKIDLLIPGVDEELPHMPAVADAAPETDILVPENTFVAQSMDKLESAHALQRLGVAAPITATMAEVEDFTFPCFAKPRQGRGSRGVRVLENREEAEAYRVLSGFPARDILLQELLQGQEFTVMMAADRTGNLHAIVPVEVDIKRGITIRARVVMNKDVLAGCRAIHDVLKPSGCYNIQLMLMDGRRAMPFEINPRVSTTFCLGIAAGIDPVNIYYLSRAPEQLLTAQDGIELNRHWKNVIH